MYIFFATLLGKQLWVHNLSYIQYYLFHNSNTAQIVSQGISFVFCLGSALYTGMGNELTAPVLLRNGSYYGHYFIRPGNSRASGNDPKEGIQDPRLHTPFILAVMYSLPR